MEIHEFLQQNNEAEEKRELLESELKDAKPIKVSSFDLLKNINQTKEWVDVEDRGIDYSKFLINRTLSYGRDTIMYAQEMNRLPNLDDQLHFDYFINILRKSKRYNKGFDRKKDELVKIVMRYYNCTFQKAQEILPLLSEKELTLIKDLGK